MAQEDSNIRQKARADRSEDKYKPPPTGNLLHTDKTNRERARQRDVYREAWNDKDRELKGRKK